VPKLWNQTIESHRRDVSEAILNAAASLASEHGALSVTMSQIAQASGIGRATLYKYFPDVESILIAWHERQVAHHLGRLLQATSKASDPREKLASVLAAYAAIARESHGHQGTELAGLVHRARDPHLVQAQHRLHGLVRDVIAEAAAAGVVRDDVTPGELASFCLHALNAAAGASSAAATRRLVAVTMAGLRAAP
jgi:AcrR family transcriptional regulator